MASAADAAASVSSSRVVSGSAETNGETLMSVQSSSERFSTMPVIVICPRGGMVDGVSRVIVTRNGVVAASSATGTETGPETGSAACAALAPGPAANPIRPLAVRVTTASARVASRVLLTAAMLSSGAAAPGEAGPGHRGRLRAP